jgi:hypothetical protein
MQTTLTLTLSRQRERETEAISSPPFVGGEDTGEGAGIAQRLALHPRPLLWIIGAKTK